jgi:hypothetical protein
VKNTKTVKTDSSWWGGEKTIQDEIIAKKARKERLSRRLGSGEIGLTGEGSGDRFPAPLELDSQEKLVLSSRKLYLYFHRWQRDVAPD